MPKPKTPKKLPAAGQPLFAEIHPTADPTAFEVAHPADTALYNLVNKRLLEPIPKPRDPKKMVLTLEETLGAHGAGRIAAIRKAKKIVFHSGGDTGSLRGPNTQNMVADKMVSDFSDEPANAIPSFFFHLGDVVYSFGEGRYYYDQFYDQYRNYPAPIVAIPGNHDGIIYLGDKLKSLEAFLRNFVSDKAVHTPESAGLMRTAMTQPGVYFAFDAPFVTIIGLYSNVLEDPGIISSEGDAGSAVDDQQIDFLIAQLNRVKHSGNAVIVAVHHPAFTAGKNHAASPKMLDDLDRACKKAVFWPHAFLSGHAHNYQRFTRVMGSHDIPYIVCGNTGHNVQSMTKKNNAPLRTPQTLIHKASDQLIFENYDDANYGYLRITASAKTLRIEYHDANPNQKSESDAVSVDLASHSIIFN